MSEKPTSHSATRRAVVKAVFVAPAIITRALTPELASARWRDGEPRERAGDRDPHDAAHHPRGGGH
jgi:hypothetical protein